MTSQTARLTSSRRNFLFGLGGLCAIAPRPAELQKVSPVANAPLPKFWFSDLVSYVWLDEEKNPQYEVGRVVGSVWNPLKKHWEYSVIWLASTFYIKSGTFAVSGETYPSYDRELIYEDEIQQADSKVVKQCKL